ncbi:uncharacterized protein V6R79_001954 [Siganus canaliculatus]
MSLDPRTQSKRIHNNFKYQIASRVSGLRLQSVEAAPELSRDKVTTVSVNVSRFTLVHELSIRASSGSAAETGETSPSPLSSCQQVGVLEEWTKVLDKVHVALVQTVVSECVGGDVFLMKRDCGSLGNCMLLPLVLVIHQSVLHRHRWTKLPYMWLHTERAESSRERPESPGSSYVSRKSDFSPESGPPEKNLFNSVSPTAVSLQRVALQLH